MPRVDTPEIRPAARETKSRDKLELERRYGSIGIPAVAAAARYHCGERTEAPVVSTDRRLKEPAA